MSLNSEHFASNNQRPSSSSLPELKLLKYFARQETAALLSSEKSLLNNNYFLFEAFLGDYIGTGRGSSRFEACLKAVAECLERKFVAQCYNDSLSSLSDWQKTSNGFAVHTSLNLARKASKLEAMERHILQMTFFKKGWGGFQLLDEKQDQDLTLTRLISSYRCGNFRAGIVIARCRKFAGMSFGYICDVEHNFDSSPKWLHAYHEAVDKIEPMLELSKTKNTTDLKPIERDLFSWLLESSPSIEFEQSLPVIELPSPRIETIDFDLMASWHLDFPFYGAYTFGSDLLPLIVLSRLRPEDETEIEKMMEKFELGSQIPQRNPIL